MSERGSIDKLEAFARLMDSRFTVPGTSIKFGLDSLLGLIPGVGDTVTLASTVYLIGVARSYDLPWYMVMKMIWNALIDWIIGIIPVVGDVFDVGWKANHKNVDIIKAHVASQD